VSVGFSQSELCVLLPFLPAANQPPVQGERSAPGNRRLDGVWGGIVFFIVATVIVLQDRQVFRARWSNIQRRTPHRLALLVSPRAAAKLEAEQRECFEEVVVINDYRVDSIAGFLRTRFPLPKPWLLVANDEYCLRLCAELRRRFGLPGHTPEQVAAFTDKVLMKRCAAAAGIPVPNFSVFDPLAFEVDPNRYVHLVVERLGLPVVAKPVDEANSRNVFLLSTVADLMGWCVANRQRSSGLELEEFIDGKVLFCNTAIQNGVPRHLMTCEYANPPLYFERGAPHGSIVLPPGGVRDAILSLNERVVAALGPIDNCVTHLEVFEKPSGELVLLEVTARAPGAFVSAIGEIHRGINFEELNFLLQMEAEVALGDPSKQYGAWMWFPKRRGTVARCNEAELASPHRLVWNVRVGDRLDDIPPGQAHSTEDASCTILLWNVNFDPLKQDFDRLKSFSPISFLEKGIGS
jgi:hypothetical protein